MRAFAIGLVFFAVSAHAALDPILDAADRRNVKAPALASGLKAKSSRVRCQVAESYGRILKPEGVDPLLTLLKDKDASVRACAAFALGQLGWQSDFSGGREADLQREISSKIGDSDLRVRLAAVQALGKVALVKAPELLAPALERKELRAEAVMALFRARMVVKLRGQEKELTELPVGLAEKLVAWASDPDESVRRNVAYYFARVLDARGEKAELQLATDKDKWTRVYALMGLGKMKSKNATETLTNAFKDPEYSVRLAALATWGQLALPMAENSALAADENYLVRAAYVQALDPVKSAGALELMLKKDPSLSVKAEALKALAKGKKDGRETWLAPFLKDPSWVMREAAVLASDGLATREAFLQPALSDTNMNVRGAALEAIGAMPSATAFATLQKAAMQDTLVERGTAVGAMKDRKETAIPEFVWQIYKKSLDRRWVEIRQDMVEIFAKNPTHATTGYLREIYAQDGDASVQDKALKALTDQGVKDLPLRHEAKLSFSPARAKILSRNPHFVFHTSRGDFRVEGFAQSAPIHVASLVELVKKHAYDGLIWHRVVPNFVLQGGDPDGTGWGDAGYSLRNEINPQPFERGSLGMPRSSGFDTGGSQLFFMPLPTPHLDGQYTVFGRITEGADVVDRLERGDTILTVRLAP